MLSILEQTRYTEACLQTAAIFALEGFEPTLQSRAMNEAVLKGKATPEQVKLELVNYIKQYKTTKGFAESKKWL